MNITPGGNPGIARLFHIKKSLKQEQPGYSSTGGFTSPLASSYSSSTTTSLRTFIGKNQFRLELIRLYERSPAFRNTLYSLMANCYQCSASDRRDMVYALLGLTEDGSAGYSIKVDYSRSTQAVDVFIAAIKAIINVEGEYPFNLSRGSGTPSAVPSWIPDFEDLEEQVSVFGIRTRTDFKAGGPGIPSVDCLDRDKTMNIAGIEVARLDRNLAPTYNGSSTETDALRAWVGLVTRHFSQRGPLTEEVVRSFLAVIWDRELQWRELPARLIADQVNLVLALTDVVVARDLELRRAVGPARFFISHDDIMGLVPGNAEPGDLIFVPCAARAPIVVRETEMQGQFTVLGECYVHGIMEGQLFNEDGTPKAHEITTIDLV
ncbi:hypothetical protein H2200_004897 [Cladophialophora chaetospira]|uniref:Heterokaryon incompatibility protein n=1 Tax=Cladophialophora chaetospira TaxID=386627 RepID=A0AA38XDY4_9EURO|nr:hypothetical protein H2200_004897 [Cladophialophora chaetospira]